MSPAERYRQSARRCLALAEVAVDPAKRTAYVLMAQQWHKLAEIVEQMPGQTSDDLPKDED